jgi:tRNA(Ile)-lysidine synthase
LKGNLRKIGSSHIHLVEEIAQGENPHAALHLPDGIRVKRAYERLVFGLEKKEGVPPFSYLLHSPGTYTLGAIGRSVSLVEVRRPSVYDLGRSRWTAHCDAEKIAYPLLLRSPRAGDRFVPLGMAGRKKLKDLFIDLKIPVEHRGAIPVLLTGNRVIWVGGIRMDDRFKVTGSTDRILQITLSRPCPEDDWAGATTPAG